MLASRRKGVLTAADFIFLKGNLMFLKSKSFEITKLYSGGGKQRLFFACNILHSQHGVVISAVA